MPHRPAHSPCFVHLSYYIPFTFNRTSVINKSSLKEKWVLSFIQSGRPKSFILDHNIINRNLVAWPATQIRSRWQERKRNRSMWWKKYTAVIWNPNKSCEKQLLTVLDFDGRKNGTVYVCSKAGMWERCECACDWQAASTTTELLGCAPHEKTVQSAVPGTDDVLVVIDVVGRNFQFQQRWLRSAQNCGIKKENCNGKVFTVTQLEKALRANWRAIATIEKQHCCHWLAEPLSLNIASLLVLNISTKHQPVRLVGFTQFDEIRITI